MLLISLFLLFLSCDGDGPEVPQEDLKLSFSPGNLQGDWSKTAEYKGQPKDSLGASSPSMNLFAEFDTCQKDDIFRYVVGDQGEENTYIWGTGDTSCEGQNTNEYIEIGNWTVQESGKLNYSYSDFSEPYVIISLTEDKLLIRKESGTMSSEGTIYEFSAYERID